jgi:prophage regulatory protein
MEYIRIWQVSNKTTMCKSHIWDEVKEKRFPQPINLSPRVTVWDAEEVDEWMEKQKAISRSKVS